MMVSGAALPGRVACIGRRVPSRGVFGRLSPSAVALGHAVG
jgi:hypothetical protein